MSANHCPPGSFNVHWFNLMNAVSFQIILGAPLILYAKSIGASSTIIGVLAAFTPILTMLQWPAAKYLPVYGYKRFVLTGWSLRLVFVFLVALVPLMGFLDSASKLVLLVLSLLVFNTLRGIASAAWMPWMAGLIPDAARAAFISRDQVALFVGSLISLVLSSFMLAGEISPWEYSLVFFVSALAGLMSLVFIKKIPEVSAGSDLGQASHPVPWRNMLFHPPFFSLLIFNLLFVLVVGSLGVFTVEYLHEFPGFDASQVLILSGISFVGSLAALPFVGRLVERHGAKPILAVSLGLISLVILGWFLVAAGILPCSKRLIGSLNFLSGMAGAAFNVANGRLALATMPVMGRNHFCAMFSVITSLGLGAAPVAWGISLDVIGTYEVVTGVFHWKRHSIYFAVLFGLNIFTILQTRRLHESTSFEIGREGR
ncbi:MAG: MFS transporter [Terrimicrobiaceae bacterium]